MSLAKWQPVAVWCKAQPERLVDVRPPFLAANFFRFRKGFFDFAER